MRARRSMQTSSSVGSSDTEERALAVMPCTVSPRRVVITVTPVAKRPIVFR